MKKITLLAAVLVAVSFASCKKEAKCECTTTMSSTTNGVADPMPTGYSTTTTSTRDIAKTSKKNAASMCGNETTTTTNTSTGGGATVTQVRTTTSTCSVK